MDAIALTMLAACLVLLGALHPTTPTTTTTLVSAMATGHQDPERFYHVTNMSQPVSALAEDRIAMDTYTYAYLNYSYTMNGQKFEMSFSEEKARYGEGKVLNVRGRLVHIMDDGGDDGSDYGCSMNVLGTHHEPLPPAGVAWIALVRRGRCTFEEKVRNVHAKGAAAVIIYNDKPVMNLEKMQIKGKHRNITAVLTYQEVGQNIVQIMSRGVDITAAIIEGRSGMRPINTLNKTSVLFVSISFIVLMIISLVWLIFYYVQRFRYLQTKDQQSRHLCSVTKKAIMKIPTKTGKISDEKDADSDCCAICIEAYKSSDCIRVLPCNHEFHKNCIDPWLIEHRTCPMCKLDVLKFYGFVFLGSEESILEYEPERSSNAAAMAAATAATVATPMGVALSASDASSPSSSRELNGDGGGGGFAELIRSRDFVLDFPRRFVRDGAGSPETRLPLFAQRQPARSQSSLSLMHIKDWMSFMTNKLDEQHGARHVRRTSIRSELHENLLIIQGDSVKRRRSRSADGRYSSGYFARKESSGGMGAATGGSAGAGGVGGGHERQHSTATVGHSRRNSGAVRIPADASYARSIQRRREELHQEAKRLSIVSSQPPERQSRRESSVSTTRSDIDIQIQLNGEGINF